jgi:hypothetical protein
VTYLQIDLVLIGVIFSLSLSLSLSPLLFLLLLFSLVAAGKYNVAFICHFLLGQVDECLELLSKSGRISEAAFMARTFAPSKIPEVLHQWKKNLGQRHRKVADSLADPTQFPNLFPDYELVSLFLPPLFSLSLSLSYFNLFFLIGIESRVIAEKGAFKEGAGGDIRGVQGQYSQGRGR